MRALLVAMQQWVEKGVEPPASQYPKVSDGQLVPLVSVQFPKVPGVAFPTRMHSALRVDYGPEFLSKGIISVEPPKVGKPFSMLVPQVDPTDGNEIAGIRLPVVRVPLGTHTGWNLRHPEIGAPDELFSMVGSVHSICHDSGRSARRPATRVRRWRNATRIDKTTWTASLLRPTIWRERDTC